MGNWQVEQWLDIWGQTKFLTKSGNSENKNEVVIGKCERIRVNGVDYTAGYKKQRKLLLL